MSQKDEFQIKHVQTKIEAKRRSPGCQASELRWAIDKTNETRTLCCWLRSPLCSRIPGSRSQASTAVHSGYYIMFCEIFYEQRWVGGDEAEIVMNCGLIVCFAHVIAFLQD